MSDAMTTHGAISWSELHTPENKLSDAFYASLFGWSTKAVEMPGGKYTQLQVGERGFGGVVPGQGARAEWLNYITVDDVDLACKIAKAKGGRVVTGPVDVPPGRIARLADPGGAEFFIIKYRPAG